MTDIARSFRDGQVQSHAVREKERSIANRRAALDALKEQLATTQEEYNRRRQALDASTRHIQPLQSDVDAQWAQRNAFTSGQEARLEEIGAEEVALAEKMGEMNYTIVDTVSQIDRLRADEGTLIPQTEARLVALERQLESDGVALSHLERLVHCDDVAVGARIEAFDAATGGKYPVDMVDAAIKTMLPSAATTTTMGSSSATAGNAASDNAFGGAGRRRSGGPLQRQSSNNGSGNIPNAHPVSSTSGRAPHHNNNNQFSSSIADIEQSMMLMADDDYDEGEQ